MIKIYKSDFTYDSEYVNRVRASEYIGVSVNAVRQAVLNGTKCRGFAIVDTESKNSRVRFLTSWIKYLSLRSEKTETIEILKNCIKELKQ